MITIDYALFKYIHQLAGANLVIDEIMCFMSSWGYILFILTILTIPLFQRKRKLGLFGILSLLVALLINRVLKLLFDRARPFVDHEIDILVAKEPSPSFPSDQALIAGVFASVIWFTFANPILKTSSIILALLVVLSRVYVGHHYPSDVAVGFLLGTCIVFVIQKWKLKRKPKTN